MTFHVPEYIRSLVPYVPGKPIEETKREFKIKRVVKLASNENPLGPSPKAKKAILRYLDEMHRYPDGSAYALKQALSQMLNVLPGQLIIGNGSNEVIELLIRTYCQAGDTIVTPKASFIAYKISAQIQGVNTLETEIDSQLRYELQDVLDCVKKARQAKVVFLANPNNPTGVFVSSADLKSFLDLLAKVRNGSVIVALDYAYWEYIQQSNFPDPVPWLSQYPNLVILRTFSKIYGLAGIRLGYGIGSPEIISHLEKVRQPFNINSLALVAGQAALSDLAFVRKAKKLNEVGFRFWERNLEKLGIPWYSGLGNFILADVRQGLGMSGTEVYQNCLRRGVIFRPVTNYGLPNALRISIGTPEENELGVGVLREIRNLR